MNANYPILEFDPVREAMVEPTRLIKPRNVPQYCVICFFKEVLEKVAVDYQAKVAVDTHWEDGPHPLYEITYQGKRLAFFHPGIGSSLSSGLLEEVIAYGCRNFIVCGGCGVLEKGIDVGSIIVVSSAVRDEGTSYHYLPPGREVQAHPIAVQAIVAKLTQQGVPFRTGKTWTTDAPYRETASKVALRKQEGCLTVEMEAAGLMAVAEYRGVVLGQVLYGGDDLSGSEWDHRGWQSRKEIRESLFWLASDACLSL